MRDVLTVTLNPALDSATGVDHVVPNVKLRCGPPRVDPGGGGINVSRAIALLGGPQPPLLPYASRHKNDQWLPLAPGRDMNNTTATRRGLYK
jgi:hypothetical protein